MKNNQSGFTLVEIAIVLVIIGLLLGGVLKGQELINSAKVKNFATDFRNIPLYLRLSGQVQGTSREMIVTACGARSRGYRLRPHGTPGNGRIEGNWNAPLPCATETVAISGSMFACRILASGCNGFYHPGNLHADKC